LAAQAHSVYMTNATATAATVPALTTADSVANYLTSLLIGKPTQAPVPTIYVPAHLQVPAASTTPTVDVPVRASGSRYPATHASPVRVAYPPHAWVLWHNTAPSMHGRCRGCGRKAGSQVHLDAPTHVVTSDGKFAPIAGAVAALPAPTYAVSPRAGINVVHPIKAQAALPAPKAPKAARTPKVAPKATPVAPVAQTAVEKARAAVKANRAPRHNGTVDAPLVTA
jgi:hypothetical protein